MNDMTRPISKLLIANRGEIARRIMRTAHAMGISTVAVYADADADAPHVRAADEALHLKGQTLAETYLAQDKIIEAATLTGADAIHPGYGFLSENAAFAAAVTAAGLVWVGPSGDAIAKMGDKLSSKELMREAGVPTLPSAEVTADADIAALANDVGYPVLIKASAGGGGKGMRIVEGQEALSEAVAGAKREAATAFGDDTVFLERWLSASRHVEIQVLGDHQGNVVHCFERECSVQRRHQKVIEEAPSSAVTPTIRAAMGDAAVRAAQAIGYTSAGTVEFLLAGDEFWFLEMNTRLQVEHPVTEEITGLDLVREQLRIAEGEALSVTQEMLKIDGHAVEARLYAEDPEHDFLPAAGTVVAWAESPSIAVRYDSGIEAGSEVGINYDPMLAKVIAHAPTRREASLKLARALETTRVQGLTTNRDFLVAALRTPEFLNGDTTTDFIERVNPPRSRPATEQDVHAAAVAAALAAQHDRRAKASALKTLPSGWRNSRMPPETVVFETGDARIHVRYRRQRSGRFDVSCGVHTCTVEVVSRDDDGITLTLDRRRMRVELTRHDNIWYTHTHSAAVELVELPRFPETGDGDTSGGLVAPMPGNVMATYVAKGDRVESGQLLLILEAMKMEHRITAPTAGIVAELGVAAGDQVQNGALLVQLADAEEN